MTQLEWIVWGFTVLWVGVSLCRATNWRARALLAESRLRKPWEWRRSPGTCEPFQYGNGSVPPPTPMPCVQAMMRDLDLAAIHLSGYHWSPLQVETTLLLADHHLARVRQMLQEEFDRRGRREIPVIPQPTSGRAQ